MLPPDILFQKDQPVAESSRFARHKRDAEVMLKKIDSFTICISVTYVCAIGHGRFGVTWEIGASFSVKRKSLMTSTW